MATEINLRTGIPAKDLSDDDLASLKKLPEELKTRVIGQDHAVDAVAKAIRRGRLGYREEKAPIGSFMFLGPTGVGKTEFVRVLAKNQFGSEKNIVRIDMSEYQEKHSVSRLVGAPPGYVGFESAGQLTEAVRRNPHTLVLFDEIEKAAPEVLDVLLQVIEDGRLTDGQGRVVDFSNAIIVMTSNIGGSLAAEALQPKRRIGFVQDEEERETAATGRTESYVAAFKAKVRPEFYNRIGKRRVVVFNELGAKEMEGILALRLGELNERVAHKGMSVRLTEAARRHILDDATSLENKAYGARPLKQAVAHEVADALVDGELDGAIKKGDAVLVDFDGTKLTVSRDPEAKPATKLGGWALGAAALGLAALPAGAPLALAVAGIAAAVGYAAWRVASSYSGPHGRAQAPPLARVWAVRAAVMTAAFLAADWALKALFFGSGLFVFHHIVPTRALIMAAAVPLNLAFGAWMLSLGHSKAAPLEKLRKFRERHPVLGAVAYGLLQVLAFPFTINDQRYAGDLAAKHPAVAKALGVFVVAAAAVLAGTLGNVLEGLVNAKVVDFIPVGHGRANLADFLVFLGIPFAWMTLDFCGAARKAVAARKPAVMNFAKYYALPVLGMLAFLLASSAGYAAIPLPAIYAAFFSTLFGVGILGANVFVQRRLAEFNGSLQDGVFQEMPAKPSFSAGYRLRRSAAAALAALAALPFVGKVVSQPRLSGRDYAALVERYRGRLPKVVITDYDDTFMDNSDGRGLVVSDARLKLLEDLKAAGVRVAFATNRPLTGGSYAMSAMLVDKMSPELRKYFILSTGGGAEVFKFSPQGELPQTPYFSGPTISEAERAVVGGLIAAEAA
ncbi:MAG: AAA family ATPase, partial [Elusimicrobia bacterium]|nr:AAA family ATPase [Elusimicrobiota bacterium]